MKKQMKKDKLKNLREKCETESIEPIVFGEGNVDAYFMLVGEAPGAKEIELGRPFVGKAGKNLDEFLEVLEIEREDLYITNVVKIRPYKVHEKTGKKSNRPPTKEEIKKHVNYLYQEIEIVQPKFIVTLGNVPLRAVLRDDHVKIGDKHGQLIQQSKYIIFPLYHPASIIYRRELKTVYMNDLYKLKSLKEHSFMNK